MSVIPTRDEFERLVVTLLNCEADAAWHKRCGTYDDATIAAMERRDEAWAAVFAAYDAQAARIEELEDERRIRITNLQAIESHANWQAARIAELETELAAARDRIEELEDELEEMRRDHDNRN